MNGKKRLNFGVIFSNLDNTCQYEIWNGIVEFANKNNVHLTAYIGTYHTADFDFTAHYDSCFEIIKDSDSLDGVIMYSGLIAGAIGNEDFEKYADRLPERIPQVSVSYELPGVPSIFIDNVAGMYSAVEHLIQIHGKKRLAFIKGPEGHPETEDRLKGYKMALAANGIAYDEKYVFPGNFTPESGRLATRSLLKAPGVDADAIVASDDLTATGVLNELENQNISVPSDIAVVGFDDDRDSATFIPSISTVRQNFFNIGKVSAETLLDKINGQPSEAVMYLTPVFVARQSCGCIDEELSSIIHASAVEQEIRFKEAKNREYTMLDNMVLLRKVASNLGVVFDIDSLAGELHKSLPELSINTAIIGLYKNTIKNGDLNADRAIDMLFGFDGDRQFKIKSSGDNPIQLSGYSAIKGFDFERMRRDLLFLTLFFNDEEYGIILISFDPGISVNTYEMLRASISTTIKGAYLIKELEHQNTLLIEASKAKSDFLSNMSHEMRTPMNAIIGMTAIGKRTMDIDEKNYTLDRIEDASTHLLNVINDVLDMAKIEANKLELSPVEFHFEKMLQKVMSVNNYRANEKEQTITVSVDSKIPRFVIGDDKRLTQVLTNLLSNAVKFTPEGGDIRLDVSLAKMTDEYCELYTEVSDSGIGISPQQQEHLFQAFEQAESDTSRKYGGTGLGLAISKKIIELMGGRIWVESELGKGAKFIFTVKVLRGEEKSGYQLNDEEGSDQIDFNNEQGAFTDMRVLLAEDIAINREIFIALMSDTGLIIECAENGKEALEMVEADPGKYDLILMDVQMPIMSGYEAARHIRALPAIKDKELPIIAMTANVFKSDIDECLAAGMNDHLGKPLEMEKVFRVLHKYI